MVFLVKRGKRDGVVNDMWLVGDCLSVQKDVLVCQVSFVLRDVNVSYSRMPAEFVSVKLMTVIFK